MTPATANLDDHVAAMTGEIRWRDENGDLGTVLQQQLIGAGSRAKRRGAPWECGVPTPTPIENYCAPEKPCTSIIASQRSC